jgi:hypothetical protein
MYRLDVDQLEQRILVGQMFLCGTMLADYHHHLVIAQASQQATLTGQEQAMLTGQQATPTGQQATPTWLALVQEPLLLLLPFRITERWKGPTSWRP